MTNFERFKAMDSDTFTDEIQKLFKTPFKNVIDWKAYMKGSSETVTDYLITEGRCRVLPSRVELLSALGAEGVNDSKKKLNISRIIQLSCRLSKKAPCMEIRCTP